MSRCPECHQLFGHHYRCPNYDDRYDRPRLVHECDICNKYIKTNEEYVENENGDMAHWECFDDKYHLLEWFGYDVKTMGDRYDYE